MIDSSNELGETGYSNIEDFEQALQENKDLNIIIGSTHDIWVRKTEDSEGQDIQTSVNINMSKRDYTDPITTHVFNPLEEGMSLSVMTQRQDNGQILAPDIQIFSQAENYTVTNDYIKNILEQALQGLKVVEVYSRLSPEDKGKMKEKHIRKFFPEDSAMTGLADNNTTENINKMIKDIQETIDLYEE